MKLLDLERDYCTKYTVQKKLVEVIVIHLLETCPGLIRMSVYIKKYGIRSSHRCLPLIIKVDDTDEIECVFTVDKFPLIRNPAFFVKKIIFNDKIQRSYQEKAKRFAEVIKKGDKLHVFHLIPKKSEQ